MRKSGSAAESEKWNCGCSLTCSHTWVAGSARGKRGRRRRFPTAIGMLKYSRVTVRGEENKEAVERIETGHVSLYCREMKWKERISHWPKQDMCHKVEEEEEQ